MRSSRTIDPTADRMLAEAIERTLIGRHPRLVLEVGFAFTFATRVLLRATDADIVSIDPSQPRLREGECGRHRVICDPSYLALPELLAEGTRAQFAYLNVPPELDAAMMDFFYVDRILDERGIVAFHGCRRPSARSVIDHAIRNRPYREVDVGLGAPTRNPVRRIGGRSPEDRYFEKFASGPPWESYDS